MNNQWLMINQLDKVLKEWQSVNRQYGRPRDGWVKIVRTALNMTVAQLAQRLGLSRARITQLENAEIQDAVTLRALRETADAMECELIYAIVPKGNLTLNDIIKKRAAQIAQERVARVAHSMTLEDQSVNESTLKQQQIDLTRDLMQHLNKHFWALEPTDIIKRKKK